MKNIARSFVISFDKKVIKGLYSGPEFTIERKEKCYYCNKKYGTPKIYTIEYKKINRKMCEKCLKESLKLKE